MRLSKSEEKLSQSNFTRSKFFFCERLLKLQETAVVVGVNSRERRVLYYPASVISSARLPPGIR